MVFIILGWLFFALGFIGAFLPVLPTTPFMLLALWAFARGSERFHAWLYNHRIFGPPLQKWDRHRVIPLHAKVLSVTAMLGSLAYMIWVSEVSDAAILAAAIVMLAAACYILPKPSRVPD
jgi:uncharacterized membrane protein YbaN (DUF454 family)